ncbi:GatB/YqeY domain-containing protein [Mycoavidus sp. SF9855]|uniref:GatB/YqeY domain-containing protein n=1 Tax=Mycoavidus sp. SF9855 TaxID=2968475 RepID=UPI00211C2F8F|nr:GatB/YqeY domain-containing protein [Mycoavidus sp. SF9855]UUM20759.1 GatB/YqeY domain-containing protein [Mycoavidus sp. SF9855]
MTLKNRITEDMKAAMRAREADRLGTIRLLLAAIKQREIDERIELDDTAIFGVIDKLIKQRKDSIVQFQNASRLDLAAKEEAELVILQGYMPQPLTEQEIAAAIQAAMTQVSAVGPQDMGKVMALLKSSLLGRADMTAVSMQVKAALSAAR